MDNDPASQPLLSPSDHESRSSSYRDDESTMQTVSEETPLLHRYPYHQNSTNITTIFTVGGLLITLLFGFIIGVYLLVVQHNADNILPPTETLPFRFINRSQWDEDADLDVVRPEQFRAECVVIEETDTKECFELPSCILLLKEVKAKMNKAPNEPMSYNFLIASDGTVYEGLGWAKPSSMYKQCPALVIVFIGEFKDAPPTSEQTRASKNLMALAVYHDMLDKYFTMIGKSKSKKEVPRYLFEKFKYYSKFIEE